jgi:hypothetical protein
MAGAHRKPSHPDKRLVFLLMATGVMLLVIVGFAATRTQTVTVQASGDTAQRAVNVASEAATKADVLAGVVIAQCDQGKLSAVRAPDGRPVCVVAVETKQSPAVINPRAAAAVPAPTTVTAEAPAPPPVTVTQPAPPIATVTATAPAPPPATVTQTATAPPPETVTQTASPPPPETVTQTVTAPPDTVTQTATPPPDTVTETADPGPPTTVTQTETAPADPGSGDTGSGDQGSGDSVGVAPLPTMTDDPQPQPPAGELNIPNPLGILGGQGSDSSSGGSNTTRRGNRHR